MGAEGRKNKRHKQDLCNVVWWGKKCDGERWERYKMVQPEEGMVNKKK